MCFCTKSKSNFDYVQVFIIASNFVAISKKQSFKPILNHSGPINGCMPLEKAVKWNYFSHFLLLRFAETDATY